MRYLIGQSNAQSSTRPLFSSSAVVLNEQSLQKATNTVRKVFFCTWAEGKDWQVRLELGHEWDWRCDRAMQEVVFSRRRFKERDLVRVALIQLFALAKTKGEPGGAWIKELDKARQIAMNLGREKIAMYLSQIIVRGQMGLIDMRYDADTNRIDAFFEKSQTERVDALDEIVHDFEDSLHISFVDRQIDQAASCIAKIKRGLHRPVVATEGGD